VAVPQAEAARAQRQLGRDIAGQLRRAARPGAAGPARW
jgi:hypothetical protein